jgi:hypothetical protein
MLSWKKVVEHTGLGRSWKYPGGEMATAELPQEEVEQQFSEGSAELESTTEWSLSSIKGNKDSMGDQADLPIEKTKVQQRRLHTKS